MPNTLETNNPDYEVQINQQYHAFLVCNVFINDSGRGKQVQIIIEGKAYKAVVSVEALRVSPNLTGQWRATLHIRCKPDGTLDKTMSLRRIRALSPQTTDQPAFWACTGDVTSIDVKTGLLKVRIYPGRRKASVFSLFVQASPIVLEQISQAKFVHLTGTLEKHSLVVQHFEPRDSVDAVLQGLNEIESDRSSHK